MSDLTERLRDGCVCHKRRWSGDTHADLGGTVNEEATDAVMAEAADRIEALEAERSALLAQVNDLKLDVRTLITRGYTVEEALREHTAVLDGLLAYADAHRWTVPDCSVCPTGACYEEWAITRADVSNAHVAARRVLDGEDQ